MNRNMILLVVFVVLLLILLGKQFLGSDGNRNFREILVELDTASVTKVEVMARANDFDPVEFVKTGSQWEVTNGNVKDEADKGSLRGALASLSKITPKRLVAKSEDKWAQYEVNDSLGTRVKAFSGDKLLADLVIGKFNFQQTNRSMSTFVRLTEEDEVYAVEGFLSSTFNREFSGFRDKTFLKTDKENLVTLTFDYPGDSSFVLSKPADQWQLNGLAADSAAVQNYLNGIRTITPGKFMDEFSADGKIPMYRLTLDGNNMSVIIITAYQEADDLVLSSSLNENAYFTPEGLNIFDKLFVSGQLFVDGQVVE